MTQIIISVRTALLARDVRCLSPAWVRWVVPSLSLARKLPHRRPFRMLYVPSSVPPPPLLTLSVQDMATAISLLSMLTNLGGAIGSAVAAAVWGHEMPKNLTKQLGGILSAEEIEAIYGSITTARTQPDNIRTGVIRAYNDTVFRLYLPALIISFVAIIAGLLASKYVSIHRVCFSSSVTLIRTCFVASTWTAGRTPSRTRSSSGSTMTEIMTRTEKPRRRRSTTPTKLKGLLALVPICFVL